MRKAVSSYALLSQLTCDESFERFDSRFIILRIVALASSPTHTAKILKSWFTLFNLENKVEIDAYAD